MEISCMTTLRTFTFVVAAFTFVGCAQQSRTGDDPAASAAVTAAGQHELAVFTNGNADSVVHVFTPDVIVMPPNEPAVRGIDSLRVWAQRMNQQFTISGRYPSSDVVAMGDWAVQRHTYDLSMLPKTGGPALAERGKGIHVYHKQTDGRWLVAQDIWNADAAAPGH
jgi:ketosteroid isomerase-like protein